MKITISKEDLLKSIQETLSRIQSFCEMYDKGDVNIAKEIAVKIRVLFHNTNISKSLLHQAKLNHVLFADSAFPYNARNMMSQFGLLYMSVSTIEGVCKPLLEDRGIHVKYENWWKSKKVIAIPSRKGGATFTRKDLILHVANKDGGAHYDPELDKDYHDLSRKNSIGWIYVNEKTNERKPLNDPVPPSIRQIAYEVIKTFENLDLEKESK